MRTRNHDWYDVSSNRPWYSFQVLHDGLWVNISEDGQKCIYPTWPERDAKRAEYRKRKTLFQSPAIDKAGGE